MSYADACCKMKEKADKFSGILRDLNTLNDEIKQKITTLLNTLSEIKTTKQKFCTVCVSRPPHTLFFALRARRSLSELRGAGAHP